MGGHEICMLVSNGKYISSIFLVVIIAVENVSKKKESQMSYYYSTFQIF